MLFNSFQFLVFFLVVCIAYYCLPHRIKPVFLLAASYYFYMCWNPRYGLLMLFSTIVTFFSGVLIGKARKIRDPKKSTQMAKIWVALSFTANLLVLFFFKYFNFTVHTINKALQLMHLHPITSTLNVLLPVGISFYTFQALSYTVDVYRNDIPVEKNFINYALFVSFFPQLVAGPIERSGNLLRQIHERHHFNWERVQLGLTQMLYGFFQKVVISDNIAVPVNQVYDNYQMYGSLELILATIGFALQIYCDFGGYSNIAIGAARVLGFDIMENFDTPYFSLTVGEFWRRWHISLSTWFRDYLYIPLGGNRKGKIRQYINLMIVFLASGLWHGAGWHFVAWGGINGLYLVVESLTNPLRRKVCDATGIQTDLFSHRLLKGLITFTLINLSWVFFRAQSIRQSLDILVRIATKWDPWVLFDDTLYTLGLDFKQFHVLLAGLLVLFAVDACRRNGTRLLFRLQEQGRWLRWAVYLILLFWILIFGSYGPKYQASQFIYFQF